MKVCTLFTGSSGNATLVTTDSAKVLIDCGISIGALKRSLCGLDIGLDELDAVLVTHEHGDHASDAVGMLQNSFGTQVFVHERGAQALSEKIRGGGLKTFSGGYSIKDININILPIKHDAAHTCAFRLEDGRKNIFAMMTDTGIVPNGFAEFIKDAGLVLVESNHDLDMLLYGEYPVSLKKRILSDFGHLSNTQCAEAIKFFPNLNIKRVFLGHLSEVNNTAELAFAASLNALCEIGAREGKDITVEVIPQGVSSGYIDLETL